jgi:hypothetical protein
VAAAYPFQEKEIDMIADPHKVKEFWLDVVRPAADAGKLDKIRPRIARNNRERAAAKNQQYWLSRRSYGGFGDNYDLIDWSR